MANPASPDERSRSFLSREHTESFLPEPYVDPDEAAAFLDTNRLKVIRMARSGSLPAYPLALGRRRQWRFKLSELDKHIRAGLNDVYPPVRHTKGR